MPFYLIRHPQGDVIVDGGNPLAVARDARAHWGRLADLFEVHMTGEQHCVAQLRQRASRRSRLRTSCRRTCTSTTRARSGTSPTQIIVHAAELDSARGEQPRPRLRPRRLRTARALAAVQGELDLFGDGSVRLLQTPGHSAGHVSLLLQLEHTGPVLLTADAVDNRAQWEGGQPPRALHTRPGRRSRERLRELARELDPLLVFGHDPGT